MYDFDVESIQDLREFIDFNRDMKLKKDRNIIYFAVQNWTLEGVKNALQMIQNRPCWNWEEVRAIVTTYFWYHQDEVVTKTIVKYERPFHILVLVILRE